MRPGAPTDEELLAAHRAGDGEAFGLIAGRHADGMWGVALRTLRHHEDAADAVQEAFIAAMRGAGRFRGDASVRTWLYRIVINTCIDRIRQERRLPATVPLLGHDQPLERPDPAAELATRMAVGDALEALPIEQRVTVVLVDVQGWSIAETAEIMDVPIGTVKSRCARARLRLAGLLGHLREEP